MLTPLVERPRLRHWDEGSNFTSKHKRAVGRTTAVKRRLFSQQKFNMKRWPFDIWEHHMASMAFYIQLTVNQSLGFSVLTPEASLILVIRSQSLISWISHLSRFIRSPSYRTYWNIAGRCIRYFNGEKFLPIGTCFYVERMVFLFINDFKIFPIIDSVYFFVPLSITGLKHPLVCSSKNSQA